MSDIIIRGMEKPKCCAECFYLGCFYGELGENSYYCGGNWQIFHKKDKKGATHYAIEHPRKGVLENCPLIELPEPHGRIIDENDLHIKDTDGLLETSRVWDAPTILEASKSKQLNL